MKRNLAIILNGLIAVAFAGALAVTGLTHEAPEAGYHASTEAEGARFWAKMDAEAGKHTVPTWTRAAARSFPNCQKEGIPFGTKVLVVDVQARMQVMDFDEAERRAHNDDYADNIWMIGSCY